MTLRPFAYLLTALLFARSGLYAEVQDQLAVDAPWVPIAHSDLVIAGRAEVQGVVLSPLGHPVYALMSRAEPK